MVAFFYTFIALSLCAYVVLDGFDLGAGIVHFIVGRDERTRRDTLRAIGPFWDGNEVWLLAVGVMLLCIFPKALATAFSGFYLALFLVLWGLILRGLSIELRSHVDSSLWRSFWDFVFCASSTLLAVLFGAALGNLLRGVPLSHERWFTLPFFTSFCPTAPVGLLDYYTLSLGGFSVLALAHHGALFLGWKTTGEVSARAQALSARLFIAVLVALLGVFVLTASVVTLRPSAWGGVAFVVAVLALASTRWLAKRRFDLGAFLASSAFFVFALLGIAATLFPTLLRAVDGGRDLTAFDAVVPDYSLRAVLKWLPFALVLIVAYFVNLFRIHRSR